MRLDSAFFSFAKSLLTGRVLMAVVLAASVSACGFHLRGNIPLPEAIQNMFLGAPEGTFKDQLSDVLENAGARLAADEGDAEATVWITSAGTSRSVGTVDERGKANSYNLIFKVKYSLRTPEGEEVRSYKLKEIRRYNFDPDLVVESESEEAELQEDMEEAIALRIVRQLSTVTNYPEK